MSEITPALTKDQWVVESAAFPTPHHQDHSFTVALFQEGVNVGDSWEMEGCHIPAYARHATSALCLYDQSYGFTREDIQALTDAILYDPTTGALSARLESLRDRISALLPPDPSP